MKEKKKGFSLLYGIARLALPIILFFLISIIISIGLLNILGFEYTSISMVIVFFILYISMELIIEPFVHAYILAVTELGRMNKFISEIFSFVFLVGFDIVTISFLEMLLDGITISNRAIILFSVITYIYGKILEELLYSNHSEMGEVNSSKKVKRDFRKKKSEEE